MGELIKLEASRLFQVQKPMGMDGLSNRELGIDVPRLQLIHAIRNANDIGRPGQWKLNSQLFDKVDVVVLRGHHYRTLVEGEKSNRPRTVCASGDGRVPLPTLEQPKNDVCPSCPYAQWRDGVGGKREAPPCSDGIALLTLVLAPAPGSSIPVQPAWLLTRKGSRQKASDLGRGLVDRGAKCFADFRVTVGSEFKKNVGVEWWEPTFTIGERTEDFRPVAQYVDEQGIMYVPVVLGGGNASASGDDGGGSAPPAEAESWDIPV